MIRSFGLVAMVFFAAFAVAKPSGIVNIPADSVLVFEQGLNIPANTESMTKYLPHLYTTCSLKYPASKHDRVIAVNESFPVSHTHADGYYQNVQFSRNGQIVLILECGSSRGYDLDYSDFEAVLKNWLHARIDLSQPQPF